MPEDPTTARSALLVAIDLLRECTDEIPGSRLTIGRGPLTPITEVWLHTEADIRSWLLDVRQRVAEGKYPDTEQYFQADRAPAFG